MDNNKLGLIYMVSSPSGKVYIGQTVKTLEKRKVRHIIGANNSKYPEYNTKFSVAIRKYGDNLVWTIIFNNVEYNQLSKLEIENIKKYNSFYNGYNSTLGGDGFLGRKHSNKTKIKMSQARIKFYLSEHNRNKMAESHVGFVGKKTFNPIKRKNIQGDERN